MILISYETSFNSCSHHLSSSDIFIEKIVFLSKIEINEMQSNFFFLKFHLTEAIKKLIYPESFFLY